MRIKAVGLFIVLGAIGFAYYRDRSRLQDEIERVRSTALAAQREGPGEVRGARTIVQREVTVVERPQQQDPAEHPRAARGPSSEPSRLEPEDVGVYIDTTFANEKADPAWARETERTIRAALSNLAGQDSRLRSVECRASMCRAEVVHGDEAQYRQFLTSVGAMGFWNGALFAYRPPSPTGAWQMTIFLGRDGASLPVPPE